MLQQLDGKCSKLLAGTSDLSNLQEKRIIENLPTPNRMTKGLSL